MRAKLGAPKAITATAHKLARIIYHMVTTRQAYDETMCVQTKCRIANASKPGFVNKPETSGWKSFPQEPEPSDDQSSSEGHPRNERQLHSRLIGFLPLVHTDRIEDLVAFLRPER
jgi:hypothetical protein